MKALKLILIFVISFVCLSNIQAQDNPKDTTEKTLYLIKKHDGGEYYGYIISDDGREILLKTRAIGEIYINKSEIKEIRVVEGDEKESVTYGEFRSEGAFTTRYSFTNNAFPIKKNENYALIHLFGPEVHFPLSDNFSFGVMSSWIASPLAFATKYAFESKTNTHFSLGTIVGSSGYLNNARGFGGLHWATITHGTRMSNISFSAGYAYVDLGFKNGVDIGEKYCFNAPNEPNDNCNYNLNSYDAYWGVYNYFYPNDPNGNNIEFTNKGVNGATVFGLSGILPVGSSASFIFDSMVFLRRRKSVSYSDYEVTVDYVNQYGLMTTETLTIGKGEVIKENNLTSHVLLMPAMRFNTSYDKAFQIALAGIINVAPKEEVQTIPIPMISWMRKF